MNLEMLFHLPFILIIAFLIYALSYKIRNNGMSAFLYYILLLITSTVIYFIIFAAFVYIATANSPF